MEKISKVPEKVEKLLRSKIVEDVVLGVDWCYNHLGKKWCVDNFSSDNLPYYSTNCYEGVKRLCVTLQYNNVEILIGGSFIQALDPGRADLHHVEFINFKTK